MERLSIDEAIKHAKEVAEKNYLQGMLCHANPNDDKLDECIKCAEEHEQLAEWLEELKTYKDIEEQGLLLKLPCKVGDKVYMFVDDFVVNEEKTDDEWLCECKRYVAETTFDYSMIGEIGKIVFLTRTEAEEALKKMEKEK